MSSDASAVMLIVLAGAGLMALAGALGIVIGWRRRKRHQAQLEKGFARARTVAQTGSGVQGTPYSIYGASAWSGARRRDR